MTVLLRSPTTRSVIVPDAKTLSHALSSVTSSDTVPVKWLGCMAALCLVQYIGTEMAGPCSSSYTGGFLQAKLLQAFSYRPVGRWSGEEVIGGQEGEEEIGGEKGRSE